jgi:Fur family ferric uptake transcriptional regulator
MTEGWQERLRERGYRLTPQRQLVLEAVTTLGHGTAEQLLTQVQRTASGVNISTVYRTLELLEELGLVRHSHLGHGVPSYHPAEHADHLHLVCRDCAGVAEADVGVAADLVRRLSAERGFETDVQHFAIYGRCARCREASPGEEHAPTRR